VEGAFGSITKILEDAGHALRSDESGYGPEVLNRLVAALPAFFRSEDPAARAAAIRGMNLLVPLKPAQLAVGMQAFIQGLAMLKDDPDPRVRRGVCQALVALFREGTDHLLEKLGEIMDFMLAKSQDAQEEVAREACEFWLVFLEFHGHEDLEEAAAAAARDGSSGSSSTERRRRRERIPEMLRAYLPRLVPVLLRGMVFSQADREVMEADAKLQLDSVPDRPEDFEPMHPRGRGGGVGEEDEEEEEEGDEEDEDGGGGLGGGDGGAVQQWNLRRCSAATLDSIAEFFGPEVLLPILLPLLGEQLQHGDVWDREACILALGAVSSCVQGMDEHLPQLFPFLLQQLDDPAALQACPELGCTVVWALSRYARWILARENNATFLSPLVERVLRTMLDRNKRVQQAACSALATFEEEAGPRLLPYMPHILSYIGEAMDRYQTHSFVVLLDALGTLADAIRHELAKPEYTAVFMPKVCGKGRVGGGGGRRALDDCSGESRCAEWLSNQNLAPSTPHHHTTHHQRPQLWARWQQVGDQDRVLLYLLECLTSLAPALGLALQPWAPEVYARCLRLLQAMLVEAQAGGEPDRDFAVCALDLLAGMAEGMGASLESLIPTNNGELLGLLLGCMRDPCDGVRQSAFALVGDLAKASCHHHLGPALPAYLPVLIENLDARSLAVVNNASWALGELTVRMAADALAPFVGPALAKLAPVVQRHREHTHNPAILENVAITLGRLAKVCPQAVAQALGAGLPAFLRAWCVCLQDVKHRGEKEHAFEGLCLLIQQAPGALTGSGVGGGGFCKETFEAFGWAVASWYDPGAQAPDCPERLQGMLRVILHYARDAIVREQHRDWNEVLSSLDPQLVQYFVLFYEL
jgi:HEAT repeat protein